jgi:hypothetical protein
VPFSGTVDGKEVVAGLQGEVDCCFKLNRDSLTAVKVLLLSGSSKDGVPVA